MPPANPTNPFKTAGSQGAAAATSAVDAMKGVGSALASIASAGSAVVNLIPGLSQLQSTIASLTPSLGNALQGVQSFASGLAQQMKSFLALNQTAFAVATALDKVGEAFRGTVAAASSVVSAFMQYNRAVNESIAAIAKFGAESAKAGASLLRMPFDVLDSAISSLQINVARFVKLASPADFQRFQMTVDNLYASIGKSLVPVLQTATTFLKSIGDAMMGLTGEGQKALQALAAGTAGMVAFAVAATAVQTVLTGGLLPLFSAVVGGLGGLVAMSDQFKPVMDQIGKVVGGVLNELGKAFTTLMPVAQPFLAFIGDIGKMLAGTIAHFSQLLSSLAPEMGAITAALDTFREAIITVVAAFQGVQVAVISTAIQVLATVLATAAPYVAAFTKVVGELVASVVRWTAGLFGIKIPDLMGSVPEGKKATSEGAAARSTSTGSVDDVLRKARESAFSLGSAANGSQEKTAANTDAINKAIREQQNKIGELVNDIKNLPDTLAEKVSGIADRVVNGVKDGFKDAAEVLIRAIPGVGAVQAVGDMVGSTSGGPAQKAGLITGGPFGSIIGRQIDRVLGTSRD